MTTGTMGMLLGTDLDVEIQLKWAVQLAEARDLDLVVFQIVEGSEDSIVDHPLEPDDEGDPDPIVHRIRRLIETSSRLSPGAPDKPAENSGDVTQENEDVIHVSLTRVRTTSPRSLREQLLEAVRDNKLKLFTVAHRDPLSHDPDEAKERRLFLRYVPCEVVFCFGLDENFELDSIMVAVASGPHAASAVRLAKDLAGQTGRELTAVRINPRIGPDAVRVGERRIDMLLNKSLGGETADIRRRVEVNDQIDNGLREVWEREGHDLVVLGASRVGMLGGQVKGSVGAKLFKGDPRPLVAIVSSSSPIRNRLAAVVEGTLERLVPQIDREERVSLMDRIQSNSQWNVDFFTLMVLSTVIASIGLIQSSAAVVIGAMLVAPLMTPLLGLGLALVQGNPVLAKISLRAVVMSLAVSWLVAFLVGLATATFSEPTAEMLGRGGPSLLDLGVAFASGLAAAYAMSRPGLLAALPGVAIAAALVPPIATSGLALSIGEPWLAFNALLLFVINTVTIVLASMTSLWAVGIRNIDRVSRWTVAGSAALLIAVGALGVYLSVEPKIVRSSYVAPQLLVEDIRKQLGSQYTLEGLEVAYDELGPELNVRITGPHLAPESVADEIRDVARAHLKRPIRVRLLTTLSAAEER
jgi:uncharacterized hydrophobic protein (TIGR00271 family)